MFKKSVILFATLILFFFGALDYYHHTIPRTDIVL